MIDPEEGHHTAFIYERGGKRRIKQLYDIDKVSWGRVRDDISGAQINLNALSTSSQAGLLQELVRATGRYELVIFRDGKRSWEGPLTLPTFHRGGCEIKARDVMHYAARTTMHAAYDNSYPNTGFVVERARLILATELARKEALDPAINVVAHIVDHQTPTDAQTSASTLPRQYQVFEHIDTLAARSGMDYTVLGRAIHLWDTSKPAMGYTPVMTEADFLGDLYVSVYGMELATRNTVTDGQGNYGEAGGVDPYYGEVELLATAYDENATVAPTVAELESQAERNQAGRNPTPLQLRIPDNSQLDVTGKFTIDMLVPGVYIPLRATLNLVKLSQMQKLQSVTVTEDGNGEKVVVTLTPATSADEEAEES